MARTHSLGRLFIALQRLDRTAPRRSRAPVYEIEYPYHTADSTVFRVLGTRGFSVGWWKDCPEPENGDAVERHLLKAITCAAGTPAYLAAARERYDAEEALRALDGPGILPYPVQPTVDLL